MPQNNSALEFCEQRLKKLESKHYSLCCVKNPDEKKFLIALFSLNLELSIVPVSASEPTIAMAKFKWWEEELKQLFSGNKLEHPLLSLIQEVKGNYRLREDFINNLLEARSRDYINEKFTNFNDLENYINSVHYTIISEFCYSFQYQITEHEEVLIQKLLYNLKAKNIYASLRIKEYNNHPFLPQELLDKLQNTVSFIRQHKAKSLINDYAKQNLKTGKEIKKTNIFKSCELIRNIYSLTNK